MNRLLDGLNDQQRAAVATTEGPLLVIAGAGSGKTRVLTRRLAYILTQRLAEPHQILAVTFTNKAAGEMKERVWQLLGGEIPTMQVSTFHSFCARFLRREAAAIGYNDQFTIFDSADGETLIKNCIKELGLSTSQFHHRAQKSKISNAKNKLVGPEQYGRNANGYFEQATADIYKLYQRRIRACNAMDFDDLLMNTVVILKEFPDVADRYRNRFKYLLVDEYQDTNQVQYLLLRLLTGESKNICVVGDEDQSIYGWRGADIRNILDFEKDFAGAKVIKLEQNYRSTAVILNAASAVIRNNEARKEKTLWTDQQGGDPLQLLLVDSAENEATEVIDRIQQLQPTESLKEQVILYRTNAQSRAFEEQLRRASLPYQIVGGISFYQRKEIKDVMAYLKLIVNIKDDVSLQRVINYPKRGIGDKTLADIAQLAQQNNMSMYELLLRPDETPELSSRVNRLQPFVELIEKYRKRAETDPVDLLTQDLVDDINLITELRNEDEIQGQTRVDNVEALIEGMAEYAHRNSEGDLATYLQEVSLFTNLDQYAEIDDKVTLMTIHAAKGLEFNVVYIAGLEEGLFPLERTTTEPMELEEERRLFYVAATRARRKLFLSSASVRFRFGEVESIPSRFLKEIPEELLERIDLRRRRRWETEERTPSLFGGMYQPKKQPEPEGVHYEYEADEMMRVGRVVQHPTFGRGRIVKIDGFGESLRLEIMFSGIGMKKIMAKYARLKVVG